MKFSRKTLDDLQNLGMSYLRRAMNLRRFAVRPKDDLDSMKFNNPKLQVLYDVLLWKARTRLNEVERRRRVNVPYAEKWSNAAKLFWRQKKLRYGYKQSNRSVWKNSPGYRLVKEQTYAMFNRAPLPTGRWTKSGGWWRKLYIPYDQYVNNRNYIL